MNLTTRSELVKFSILPPGFKLEVSTDENGYLVTSRMGLNNFTSRITYGLSFNHRVAQELGVLFWQTFAAEPIIMSSVEPDGNILVWLRSRYPYHGNLTMLKDIASRPALPEASPVFDI